LRVRDGVINEASLGLAAKQAEFRGTGLANSYANAYVRAR
jgi:hypothetical protein